MALRIDGKHAAALLTVAAGIAAPSAAAGGDRHRADVAGNDGHRADESFQGTCQFSGTLRQDPPLTNTPQAGRASAIATGVCTGTLTDSKGRVREMDGARAGYFARAAGTTSCAGGTAAGAGFLRIRGERIDFRFSEVRGPGAGAIRLEGVHSGAAVGAARVSEDEDPVRIAEACSGAGLRQVRIQIDIATAPAIAG